MKFQIPSLNFLLNGRTDGRKDERTHKPKPICSPLFQSWGHNENIWPTEQAAISQKVATQQHKPN